ncbi:MAG: hypothetical protein ACM362_03095 [Candidatus Methylomirabilota bacterium]|jgi:hypothetical protein
MRKDLWVGMLGAAALLVSLSACSARDQLALEETRINGAHFATWRHMGYSINRGTAESTTKADVEASQNDQCLPNQKCKWWGEVVQVAPIQ